MFFLFLISFFRLDAKPYSSPFKACLPHSSTQVSILLKTQGNSYCTLVCRQVNVFWDTYCTIQIHWIHVGIQAKAINPGNNSSLQVAKKSWMTSWLHFGVYTNPVFSLSLSRFFLFFSAFARPLLRSVVSIRWRMEKASRGMKEWVQKCFQSQVKKKKTFFVSVQPFFLPFFCVSKVALFKKFAKNKDTNGSRVVPKLNGTYFLSETSFVLFTYVWFSKIHLADCSNNFFLAQKVSGIFILPSTANSAIFQIRGDKKTWKLFSFPRTMVRPLMLVLFSD